MMKNKKPLGLYIHIPFCVRKCLYCDFLSFPSDESERLAYIQALCDEICAYKDLMSNYYIDTIFIGGGTPSILTLSEMDAVFTSLYDVFSLSDLREFTIECNPGTVSTDKYKLYKSAGVDRISLGMQSAEPSELVRLGRIHSYEDFLDSYNKARQAGFSNINVDVMFAIPGQTLDSYRYTLQSVLKLEPEHISSYSLIVEEGTPFYDIYAHKPPVDENTDRCMYEETYKTLGGCGYDRYEISNYAKPGYRCIHNLKYWQREEYLGVGLGAASFLSHKRYSNERDISAYIHMTSQGIHPVAECETVDDKVAKEEYMYLGLRCMEGVSITDFKRQFGEDIRQCFGPEIDKSIDEGLLVESQDRIHLTPFGIDVSNIVFERFIS